MNRERRSIGGLFGRGKPSRILESLFKGNEKKPNFIPVGRIPEQDEFDKAYKEQGLEQITPKPSELKPVEPGTPINVDLEDF